MTPNIFGADGFFWWIGVVEDREDPSKLGRCRVRILGYHIDNKEVLPTDDLPWAVPLQPITSAAVSGVGQTPLGPVPGTWVMGFFVDGKDCQQPMFMGTFAASPDEIKKCAPQKKNTQNADPNNKVDSNGNPVKDETGKNINNPPTTNPSSGTIGALDDADVAKLREIIGQRESGGKYDIVNQIGFVGKYQFGAAALQTVGLVAGAKKNSDLNGDVWSGKYGCNSIADWKANKNGCQDLAMNELLKSNYKTLGRIGVLNAQSSKAEVAGYLTTSHLLGAGGARDLKNGVVGKDANGTTGASYYALGSKPFGGTGDVQAAPPPGVNTVAGSGNGGGRLNDPSMGHSEPFADPNGEYPDCDYAGQADTNKLARGPADADSDLKGTIVESRKKNATENVPVANGGKPWNEPAPAYNAKYPYNQVTETEGGHVVEMDSTPGAERMNWHHKAGTYEEIDVTGTRRHKVVGENYEIIVKDNHVFIQGACDVTVAGAWSLLVKDTANIEIAGKTTVNIKSDATVNVSGKANITVKDDASISAKNLKLSAQQDVTISAGKSLNMSAGASAKFSAGASMKINSGVMSLDAGNISLNGGGMLGGIAGALGGGILEGALGGAVQGLSGLTGLADLAGIADLTELGDLAGLDIGALSEVAGFDLGQLGELTGLDINSLGDLAGVNLGSINMADISSLTKLDIGSIGKLASAAGLDIPGLDKLSSLSGASLTAALKGELGDSLKGLSLSSFDGLNISKLGDIAGVDVKNLTSLVGVKDLANISNLNNIGNQLGLENVLNKTSLEGLNIGKLNLPSFNPANIASFSPQSLLGGTDFIKSGLANGTFSTSQINLGNNLVNKATASLGGSLGSTLSGLVGSIAGGKGINTSQLTGQITSALSGGKSLNSVLNGVLGSNASVGNVLNQLAGKTANGISFDLTPITSLVQSKPTFNEFVGFTDFPPALKVSKYFSLGNLTSLVGEPSLQNKLVAQLGMSKSDIAGNLKDLGVNVLDPIKEKYPHMQVMTGFVQGQQDNPFSKGQAVNLQFFGANTTDYYNYATWIKNNVAYDQMILNYKTTGDQHPWIYLSFNPDGNREAGSADKVVTCMNNTKVLDGLMDIAALT